MSEERAEYGSEQVLLGKAILGALAAMHSRMGWLFVPELRAGTGYGALKEQRLDGWAIQAWASVKASKGVVAPHLRRAFEIKVSAADLKTELRNPDKRWFAYAVSHEFYFVAPAGLVDPALLDSDDGLMEWDGVALKVVKQPPVRTTMPPRWDFVASVVRTLTKEPL